MILANQKRVDIIVRSQKCLHQRKGEFLDWIGFEDSVRVDRSQMMRGGGNFKEKGQHVKNHERQEQC